MIAAAKNEAVRLHIQVYDDDGYTPLTGLVDGDFTKEAYLEDSAVVGVVGTITEIDSSGTYQAVFTPDEVGIWRVNVGIPSVGNWYAEEVKVTLGGAEVAEAQMNSAYDDAASTLYVEVWLDRGGKSVPAADLISCSVEIFDVAGLSVAVLSSASPQANGKFSMTQVMGLTGDRPYKATVTVVDTSGTVTTFQAFTTVE